MWARTRTFSPPSYFCCTLLLCVYTELFCLPFVTTYRASCFLESYMYFCTYTHVSFVDHCCVVLLHFRDKGTTHQSYTRPGAQPADCFVGGGSFTETERTKKATVPKKKKSRKDKAHHPPQHIFTCLMFGPHRNRGSDPTVRALPTDEDPVVAEGQRRFFCVSPASPGRMSAPTSTLHRDALVGRGLHSQCIFYSMPRSERRTR